MSERTRIVILGGGFAGTTVALRLERLFRRDPGVEITLLDSENFFTFTPLLPEVPSGSIQPKHIVFPLRALLRKTCVRQAEVLGVDVERRIVTARHCGKCGRYRIEYRGQALEVALDAGAVATLDWKAGRLRHA